MRRLFRRVREGGGAKILRQAGFGDRAVLDDAGKRFVHQFAHRDEAVELLVQTAHSNKDDAAASYDLLRRTGYFEPTSKVSRAKLRNLINEERRAGNIGPTLTPDRLVMPGVTELVD